MSKKRFLPFGWSPSHWGLKGKVREVARAEHELEGEELERALLEINLAGRTEKEIAKVKSDLDLRFLHINPEEHDRAVLELRKDEITEKEYKIESLRLDKKYEKITEEEFTKYLASANEEPYVRVAKIETDPANPSFGGIILDWNKAFVLYLEENGYGPAPTDEEIVDQWFTELCKNIALDAFDGIGDFNEQLDASSAQSSDIIYKRDLKKDTRKDK